MPRLTEQKLAALRETRAPLLRATRRRLFMRYWYERTRNASIRRFNDRYKTWPIGNQSLLE